MDPQPLMTKEEQDVYLEFRKRVEADVPLCIRDDSNLYLRFLRARDLNIQLAENMLRTHIEWRKTNQIDSVSFKEYKPIEAISKYLPLSRLSLDKEGAPVVYVDLGNIDTKGLMKSFKKNDVIKAVLRFLEDDIAAMKEQTKKLGKLIDRWTMIFNFKNFTFAQATNKLGIDLLVSIFSIYEANYPEILKDALIINASVYFTILFAVVKPLLSGATLRKISIYGKDGWKDKLLNTVHCGDLPAFLGGNKTDPDGDPMCKSFIKHGMTIPEEFYTAREANRLKGQPGVQRLTVSRRSKTKLEALVVTPGSVLEWAFETEHRDIGFAVLFKDTRERDSLATEVVPKQRLDSHMGSEVGMFCCEEPGLYILVFDNSYSWIYQKELYCKVEMVTAKGQRILIK